MKVLLFSVFFAINISAAKIEIAVASNISYVLSKLIATFNQKYPNIKVNFTLLSSGVLTAQIEQGARYGLFLSANEKYPNYLFNKGFALKKPKIYAKGSLALFSIRKIDIKEGLKSLDNLKIKKIAIANPKIAPYGQAAMQALSSLKLDKKIASKFVFAESISQALFYALKATDAAIIAKAALYDLKMRKYKEGQFWVTINPKLHKPINQAIVQLKGVKNPKDYEKFYNFIFSTDAKKILKDFGYILP